MRCTEPVRDFTIIFQEMEQYAADAKQSGEVADVIELEEVRILREFVADVAQERPMYFTRT